VGFLGYIYHGQGVYIFSRVVSYQGCICWTQYGKFTTAGNGEPLFTSPNNGEKNSPLPAVVKKLVTTAGSGEFFGDPIWEIHHCQQW